jgi:hypothetical protein
MCDCGDRIWLGLHERGRCVAMRYSDRIDLAEVGVGDSRKEKQQHVPGLEMDHAGGSRQCCQV